MTKTMHERLAGNQKTEARHGEASRAGPNKNLQAENGHWKPDSRLEPGKKLEAEIEHRAKHS